MMGMHLVQGLDFGVAQGGDILHEVCSLNIGWIKAHRDTSMGRMQSSGAILSKSDWISYQNLCPGTYETFLVSTSNPESAAMLNAQRARKYGMRELPPGTERLGTAIVVT